MIADKLVSVPGGILGVPGGVLYGSIVYKLIGAPGGMKRRCIHVYNTCHIFASLIISDCEYVACECSSDFTYTCFT